MMTDRLLAYFMDNKDQYISGEQLSREFGCSRTAIWKQINVLRLNGYSFDAIPRRGYRLIGEPSRFSVHSLLAHVKTEILGRSIRLFDEVDSTQNVAHKLVREGAQEGTIVIAEAQTAGRGRMGRKWHSPKGKGIWMSLVLKPEIPLPLLSQLTLLIAVALCRSVRRVTGLEAGIKWPNDLLVDGRKISGILLESSAEDERLHYVIAGIGISANLEEKDFPPELRNAATSLLIETGREIEREVLIGDFLGQLEEFYRLYTQQGFTPIRLLWEALSVSLHRPIRVNTERGVVEGSAVALDETGALIVELEDGKRMTLYSGEVHLTKPDS
jgi:BirA family biotin operon repressor/biotin-[acetyl-CoA-carboxylase] ligase